MAELNADMLEEVTGRILEDAAFVFAERVEDDWGETERIIRAEVVFHGAKNGKLHISTTHEFAEMLAANLLGLDMGDESAGEYSEDAVKELTNIVGGELLAAWLGADSHYEMGVPESTKTDIFTQKKLMESMLCWVPLLGDDEYRIDVAIEAG